MDGMPSGCQSSTLSKVLWFECYAGSCIAQGIAEGPGGEELAPAPSPEPTPEPAQEFFPCSYKGKFFISPLFWNCGKRYLSYIYPRCDSVRVALRKKEQLRSKPQRAVWKLNGAASGDGNDTAAPIETYMRSKCFSKYLQDIAGDNLQVGDGRDEWVIVPVDGSNDCYSSVSLYSPTQQAYLSVSPTCDSFSFEEKVGDRQLFEVKQVL